MSYSRKNWVGLNPFTHISAVQVRCDQASEAASDVHVCVDRTRALYLGLVYAWAYLLIPLVPLVAAILLVLSITAMLWYLVHYVPDVLVRHELCVALRASAT
jgi:hypothetical protein